MTELAQTRPGAIRAFTFDEAITRVDNNVYKLQDLNLKDTKGRITFTISITSLKPLQQTTGHRHQHEWEVYEFAEGKGIMQIERDALFINAGDCVYVEPGMFHKLINTSNSTNLVFRCYFAGEIRRPHLAPRRP